MELLILCKSPESIVALPSEISRLLTFFMKLLEIRLTNCSSVRHSVVCGPLSLKSLFQIDRNLAPVRQSQSDSAPPPPPPP